MHILHTNSFNTCFNCTCYICSYDKCLRYVSIQWNYLIFNMQDFIYCLLTSILDCFGQLVSPPCIQVYYNDLCHCDWTWPMSGIAGSPVLQLFLAISISFKSTFLVFLLCYLVTLVSDLCISDIILSLITLDGGFFAYCTPVDSPPLSTMQKQILKVTSPLSSYVAMTSMLILIM